MIERIFMLWLFVAGWLAITVLAYGQPVRSLILCPAAQQAACNAAAVEIAGQRGGENTFTVPLCAEIDPRTDCEPVYYIANWQFDNAAQRQAFYDSLQRRGVLLSTKREAYTNPDPATEPEKQNDVMTREGLKRMNIEGQNKRIGIE